jgi:tRNA-modifying protein YgfZ
MSLPVFPDQNRPDRAVISLAGDSVLAWLNNILTCDVSTLVVGSGAYGALLNPQGKILHDMFIFNAGERVLIDCAETQRAALLQKLVLYRLRAKLMIEIDNELEVGVHLAQPDEGMSFADPRHPDIGWRSFQSAGTLINAPGHRYDERRIVVGLGDSVSDIGVEKTFPHEANFDQFGGVDFKKGCYVGQEVVSRMQHRGTARNRMLPVMIDGETQGSITADEKVIGDVLSRAGQHALALLRIDRLADVTGPLLCGQVRVRVVKPDWIAYDVAIPEAAR